MFDVKVESENGVCKIKLYPSDPDLEIGGYGREDVIVFKGAPVSIAALQKMLEREFGNTLIFSRKNSLEVELQRPDCTLVVDGVAKAIEEMMENAAKDLEEIEELIKESLRKYIRRTHGDNGD
ncbi:hypothetical protein [Archaeoglobus sp.]